MDKGFGCPEAVGGGSLSIYDFSCSRRQNVVKE